MTFGQWIMLFAILAICLLLILVVLLQRGRGGGLAGAFGGGGGSSAFGAKTGDVFTGVTVAFAFVFLLLNVFGNYALRPAGALENKTVAAPTVPVSTPEKPAADTPDQAATPEGASAPVPTKTPVTAKTPAPPVEQQKKPAPPAGGQPKSGETP